MVSPKKKKKKIENVTELWMNICATIFIKKNERRPKKACLTKNNVMTKSLNLVIHK